MSRNDVELKIDRDADGRLLGAGVQWGETRPSIEHMVIVLGVISFFVTGLGFIGLYAVGMNPLFTWGLFGLAFAIGVLVFMPGAPRGVYFRADGRMTTPWGIYYHPHISQIEGNHDHVVSIETRVQRSQSREANATPLFELIMLSGGGDLICVSRNTHEWVALKAAAQLTHALSTMRRERADAPSMEAWGTIS